MATSNFSLHASLITQANKMGIGSEVQALLARFPADLNFDLSGHSYVQSDRSGVSINNSITGDATTLVATYLHEVAHIENAAAKDAEWKAAANVGSFSLAIQASLMSEARAVVSEAAGLSFGFSNLGAVPANHSFSYLSRDQFIGALNQTIAQVTLQVQGLPESAAQVVDTSSLLFVSMLTNNVANSIRANDYNGSYTLIRGGVADAWLKAFSSVAEHSCTRMPDITVGGNVSADEISTAEAVAFTAGSFVEALNSLGDYATVDVVQFGDGAVGLVGRDEAGNEVFRVEIQKNSDTGKPGISDTPTAQSVGGVPAGKAGGGDGIGAFEFMSGQLQALTGAVESEAGDFCAPSFFGHDFVAEMEIAVVGILRVDESAPSDI